MLTLGSKWKLSNSYQLIWDIKAGLHNIFRFDRESVAGFVIQVTKIVEFEDGLWIGNHLKARNCLQRVRTIPRFQPGVVRTPGLLWRQTEFQSAWVCVDA